MNDQLAKSENMPPLPQHQQLHTDLQAALQAVDDIVLKNYLAQLETLEIVPLDRQTIATNLAENVRFFKITEMVYEKDEYSTYKFASVFNALSATNCAVFTIIDSNGEKTDFYMGIRSLDSDRTTNSLKDTLRNAMQGQFPGIKVQEYLTEDKDGVDMEDIISAIKANSISAVSCVANSKDEENHANISFLQGLEKLALSMQGEKYTAIILANGTPQSQLSEIRKGYEQIYTQLSPFANVQLSYASNTSLSLSQTITHGTAHGTNHTTNRSDTRGSSVSDSMTDNDSISKESAGSKTVKGIAAAGGILGAALAPVTGGISLAVGGVALGGLGLLGAAIQKTETHGTNQSHSVSENESHTVGESDGVNDSVSDSLADAEGRTAGSSQNLTMTVQDKSIQNILDRIDIQLKRLHDFESLGMWECAAYFLSESPYTAEIAGSTYKALMRGENSGVEVCAINSWNKSYEGKKVERLREYITNFMHPSFLYRNKAGAIPVTPCSLVSGNELALHMGLPRKSVCGFPVIEHADFGKEVVNYNGETPTQTINLGKIFNMGSECSNTVLLDKRSLSMHTFITGSTGSGKSNTVYELLRQLSSVGIKFLIIEPAKGEYKNIFGRMSDVHVLGTNPQYNDLLHINPFRFPAGIHLLEHIDRLIEIFSVCWPMYAAMPAVLKDAVLQAYEVCGWNLVTSVNKYEENLFPTFSDLQNELVGVIERSAYSQELKSNYIGSLVTRVKSLTNGLNGQIFSAKEMDNRILFDENVIVDLSRIGSAETKSLIMGIFVMRLSEHRMAHATGMNAPLKHITVLEEAHNILKRTASEQNQEGSGIGGKSVEMIANAIAEMRTYGEGFIIADQSPSAVDLSAIRNTNTKIIMRLPDETDRRLAGKSAALRDEQLDEIAKLPRGVAVVYQNDWAEPILCKVRKFPGSEQPFVFTPTTEQPADEIRYKSELLKLLLKGRTVEKAEPDIAFLRQSTGDITAVSTKNKLGIFRLMDEYKEKNTLAIWQDKHFLLLADMVSELLCTEISLESTVQTKSSFACLNRELLHIIDTQTRELSDELRLSLCQCLMKSYTGSDQERLEIYSAWRQDIVDGGRTI